MVRVHVCLIVLLAGFIPGRSQSSFESLESLIRQSSDILSGEIIAVSDGFVKVAKGQLPYTEVSVRVEMSILGTHSDTFTFRQFGLLAPRMLSNGMMYTVLTPEEWPDFEIGERVLLFMHQGSNISGLRAPVGLVQGKFLIRNGLAVNGAGNLWLFDGMDLDHRLLTPAESEMLQIKGPVDAQLLIELVDRAVRQGWF